MSDQAVPEDLPPSVGDLSERDLSPLDLAQVDLTQVDLTEVDLTPDPVSPGNDDFGFADEDAAVPIGSDGGGQIICVPANGPCQTGQVCCATGCVTGALCPD